MFIYGDLNNTNKYIVMRSYFYFIDARWRNKSKYTAPPPAPLPTTRTLIKLILSRAFGKIKPTSGQILKPLQKYVVTTVVKYYILFLKTTYHSV